MKPLRFSPITRLLARIIGRRSGEIRALQDLHALQGVLRFGVVFGLAVMLPTLLLAWLALSSIRAEELSLDAEISRRTEALGTQLHRDLEDSFTRFEQVVLERLRARQTPLRNLGDLSPYVRAAFRFDGNEHLAAPFTLPAEPLAPDPPPLFHRLHREAQRLEVAGQYAEAAEAYLLAGRVARDRSHAGEVSLSRARMLARNGQVPEAERALADVYADFANVRDRRGFRLGDLATLTLAELAMERDPQIGAAVLQDLVEDLLQARWVIGRPGEAAVIRRALRNLEGKADPEWLGGARARLDETTRQVHWAERLTDELELLPATAARSNPGDFRYYHRLDAESLWATVWWEDSLYAFSFHYPDLLRDLRLAAAQADAHDEDLRVQVLSADVSLPSGAAVRTLGRWLPTWVVAVYPADPAMLQRTKTQRRWVRVLIILLAVGTSALGMIFAARLVGRELESARMKTDFAANVSHELRSPITQIRLKGEALQLNLVYDDEDRQRHYDAIVHESERLSRLVDNVLDFAAIESGTKKYIFRPEDMAEILRNTVEAARTATETQAMEIELDVPDDLPVVWVDREAVGQVVTNLISNAAKYGAEGGAIEVRARLGLEGLEVSVRDQGMGMSQDEADRIFDRFYRSADPRVRRRRGTGIGLTIVRYIVDAHGGGITVDSAPGRGTTFTISFPLEPRDGTGAQP